MKPGATWRGTAHAKVNLSLRVLAREESGYHQLETVFQALELGDGVELALRDEPGVALEVIGVGKGELGPDEENLAVRGAKAYLEALEPEGRLEAVGTRGAGSPGVAIRLEKRIPHGAGLGGGSSDAAAVLRGMNALFGAPLGDDDLVRLGGALGADVPFFVTGAFRALGWGRGDRLLPLPALPQREMVVVVPPEGMSTPLAYRLLAEHRERVGTAVAPPTLVTLSDGSWEAVIREAENDFEAAVLPARPDIRALRDALAGAERALTAEAGAFPALMAGSGSGVFGIFSDAEGADRAAEGVEGAFPGVRVFRTRSLG
jgi:4-diphosphocytidyl-2-C-methyl-D-erythritol kinase